MAFLELSGLLVQIPQPLYPKAFQRRFSSHRAPLVFYSRCGNIFDVDSFYFKISYKFLACIYNQRQGMRPKREVYLSAFLTEQTSIVGKSATLQNKNISVIDQVSPFLCGEIESLNLHKNKLSSLKNISQFHFLKELDISSNKIINCSELTCLKDLHHLRKIYVSDNPFLSEPLDERILDFLLERETDIEILSFEVLNSIKEVEEEEIKIIFLKNYLSKIGLHEELKQKELVHQGRPKMKTEELIDKIIPQFYTIIEDPKMTSNIKRQAIDLKKKKNATIQYALKSTKKDKSTKINQLIGDIVHLLHQSASFKEERTFLLQVNYDQNTISFSPGRQKQLGKSMKVEESEQFSPVKYMELSKEDNTLQQFSLVNSKRVAPQLTNLKEKVPMTPVTEQFSETNQKATPIKVPLVEKLNNFSNFKHTYQTQLKKIRERQSSSIKNNQFESIKMQQSAIPARSGESNHSKQKIVPPLQLIKVMEEKDSIQTKKEEQSFKKTSKVYKNNEDSNIYRSLMLGSRESLTSQLLQTIYFRNLSKVNPMFNLLYSPANSLTEEQKNNILESLKIDHKQKSIQLMKQRNNNQTLMREIEQARAEFHDKMEDVVSNSRFAFQENIKLKEDYQWIQQRYKDLQADYYSIFNKLKEVQSRQKNKTAAMTNMESSYKKIKDSYKEKVDELSEWAALQQKQQKIIEKHSEFVKLAYLKLLKKKGQRWKRILKTIADNTTKDQQRLKAIGIYSFKLCKQFKDSLRQIEKKKEQVTIQQHFKQWVFFKETETKQKLLFIWLKNKRCQISIDNIKKYQANSKMKKLKQIWADRFLHQRILQKNFVKWKELRVRALNKQQKSINFYQTKVLSCYLQSLKLLISNRKERIECFAFQHLQKKKEKQFKRMVNLIRKQNFQVQEKQNKVQRLHEYTQRKTYIQKLKRETGQMKQVKQKYHALIVKKQQQFCSNLARHRQQNITLYEKKGKLMIMLRHKASMQKLKLIKYLQIARLQGKNYIKHRTIQEMNTQMDQNDRTALQIVRFTQEEVDIYKRDAAHLKQLILTQQHRQKELLLKNDSLLLSIKETLDIVDEMRAQITSLEKQYLNQIQRNQTLTEMYNGLANAQKQKH